MRSISHKRGSALLMVLGMIAFMIVSALGFAAYMRYSRLPSSYIRRHTAARQLAKAGLARAIDDIDMAINANPHPGIGTIQIDGSYVSNPPGNYWKNRVFMGYATNLAINAQEEDPGGRWSQTVPVLTLEGLAYIPPTLVNDVRVYSRITSSAEWHNLDYDAGRYAYVAVDVSDYFDVNRMVSGKARSSAGPRRVSFSYLFETGQKHESMNSEAAEKFDEFLNQFRTPVGGENSDSVGFDYTKRTPIVSVADLNLAVWKQAGSAGIGGMIRSPFCAYMQGQGDYAGFYGITGQGSAFDEMYEMTSRHTFVTDGFYPAPEYRKRNDDPNAATPGTRDAAQMAAGTIFQKAELSETENQPLTPQLDPRAEGYSVMRIVDAPYDSSLGDEYISKLSCMGLLCLADYLDLDSKPLSLMLPTWEQCPMIGAIQPWIPQGQAMELSGPQDNPQDAVVSQESELKRKVRRVIPISIDADNFNQIRSLLFVNACVVNPYTFPDPNAQDYYVDGVLKFFFTDGEAGLRVKNTTSDPLHVTDTTDMTKSKFDLANGMFSLPFGGVTLEAKIDKVTKRLTSEQDAIKVKTMRVLDPNDTVVNGFRSKPILTLTYEWDQTRESEKTARWQPDFNSARRNANNLVKAECAIKPLKPDSYTPNDTDFSDDSFTELMRKGNSVELKLNVAVWGRVRDSSTRKTSVVDMVPACASDDFVQNPESMSGENQALNEALFSRWFCGEGYPLLRFDTGISLKLSLNDLEPLIAPNNNGANRLSQNFEIKPNAAVCADPRFNYAPEHWFGITASPDPDGPTLTEDDWYNNCHAGDAGRDGDIFLAIGNQGYLQSPYEFAFIPRFTNLYSSEGDGTAGADADVVGSFKNPGYSGRTTLEADFSQVENSGLMWKSYDPFGTDRDAFADLGVTARGTGVKVNPFSDSINILMAAFANTPVSWQYASTNNQNVALEDLDAGEFNTKYAVNAYGSEADTHIAMPWDKLRQIAEKFSAEVRTGANAGDWERAFEGLGWTDDPEAQNQTLCGVELDPTTPMLSGVDRKFLYGFWRDCFSADQQLFLIFVRAEPTMMGGEITGQVPPNLGARAVALVWRDPRECMETPTGDYGIKGYPHKTRIIFYHSLD